MKPTPSTCHQVHRSASLKIICWLAVILLLGSFLMGGLARGEFAPTNLQSLFSWIQFETNDPPATTPELLARGRDVYLVNCAICHGPTGKGNGRWAHMLYPRPRNFSRGIFRFKSTVSGSLPRDQDVFRTVSVGLQGTAMPAWKGFLAEEARWSVVAYIKTFSRYFDEEGPGKPVRLGPVAEMTAERAERGQPLYGKAGCVDCHGTLGYGDGPSAKGMQDSFGAPIAPRNFHQAQEFKRGRTLADIALTIATGNDGTPMPSYNGALSEDQLWDLASFVMSLEVEPPRTPMRHCPMGRMGRF